MLLLNIGNRLNTYFFFTGCFGVTRAFITSSKEPFIFSFSSYLLARFDFFDGVTAAFFGVLAISNKDFW